MKHLTKKTIWFCTILGLGLILAISSCGKSDKKDEAAAIPPDTSLQGIIATELKAELISEGVPSAQAHIVSNAALIEANSVMGVSSSVRAISKSAIILVAPAITQGAMKSIGEAQIDNEIRQKVAGIIARSIMKSLNGRAGIMDIDKMEVLYKDVADGAIGNLDDGRIPDKVSASEEVMNKFVGHLDDAGLPSEDVSVAVKNLNSGAVRSLNDTGLEGLDKINALAKITGGSIKALGDIDTKGVSIATTAKAVSSGVTESLDGAGFKPSDLEITIKTIASEAVIQLQNIDPSKIDTATKTQAIGNIASGTVGAIGKIKGLTSAQITSSSKFVTEGITKSLVKANIPAADRESIIVNTSSFAVRGLDASGLPKLYIKDAALGMLDTTYKSLGDAEITDKAAALDKIKDAMIASLDKIYVLKADDDELALAKQRIRDYDPATYTDNYGDQLVCTDLNKAGCELATCSDQKDPNSCSAVAGCTWDETSTICKEETADTVVMQCPTESTSTSIYPECICTSGIFDKATNTCVANATNCPSNATGTAAPDCTCTEADIIYDPTTNTCGSNACPDGSTGVYPSCVCETGIYDEKTNSCQENICPIDAKGTYPDCVCELGKYDPAINSCITEGLKCPLDAIKGELAPDCACAEGYEYNSTTNTCDALILCPKEAKGTYPTCDCVLDLTKPVYNTGLNECVPNCPKDSIKGIYPDCVCDTGYAYNLRENICVADQKCPAGAIGVYPKCDCTEGTYDEKTNTCIIKCPADAYTGTVAPDCTCIPNNTYPANTYYDATNNVCEPPCPKGSVGNYPDCDCSKNTPPYIVYDLKANACVAPPCPTGATGIYPTCDCAEVKGYPYYYPTNNICVAACPTGTVLTRAGTCEVPPCPTGALGTYPTCDCSPVKGLPYFYATDNICVEKCPDGTTLTRAGICEPDPVCPTGALGTYPTCDCSPVKLSPYYYTAGNACVEKCPDGTTLTKAGTCE